MNKLNVISALKDSSINTVGKNLTEPITKIVEDSKQIQSKVEETLERVPAETYRALYMPNDTNVLQTYRKQIVGLSKDPNCNKYELKKLITDADNEITSRYWNAIKLELNQKNEKVVSKLVKDLEVELQYMNENPEYAELLDKIRHTKYKPNGQFDGYEHALDKMYNTQGINYDKTVDIQGMINVLRDNWLENMPLH